MYDLILVCFAVIERKLNNTVIIHLCIWFHAHTCMKIFLQNRQNSLKALMNNVNYTLYVIIV